MLRGSTMPPSVSVLGTVSFFKLSPLTLALPGIVWPALIAGFSPLATLFTSPGDKYFSPGDTAAGTFPPRANRLPKSLGAFAFVCAEPLSLFVSLAITLLAGPAFGLANFDQAAVSLPNPCEGT